MAFTGQNGRGYLRRPLDWIFRAPSHVALLRVLKDRPTGATGRHVASEAGMTHKAAHDALARLEQAGIVRRLPAGRAYIFQLNRRHRLVRRGILPLLELERDFREQVKGLLRKGLEEGVVSGAVFGSVARGEEESRSDLDACLLVERESQTEEVSARAGRLSERLNDEYGVRLAPVVFTRAEFTREYRGRNPFFRKVVAEGETFAGLELREVVRGKAHPAKPRPHGAGRQLRRGR